MQPARNLDTRTRYDYGTIEEAFPTADPGAIPFGNRVLVQIRTPKKKSRGGIELIPEAVETELWNTQVARVVTLGPVAFRNRDTLEPWPEGDWCKPGDFVRVPKYGGDRWNERRFSDVHVLQGSRHHRKAHWRPARRRGFHLTQRSEGDCNG